MSTRTNATKAEFVLTEFVKTWTAHSDVFVMKVISTTKKTNCVLTPDKACATQQFTRGTARSPRLLDLCSQRLNVVVTEEKAGETSARNVHIQEPPTLWSCAHMDLVSTLLVKMSTIARSFQACAPTEPASTLWEASDVLATTDMSQADQNRLA